MIDLKEYIRNGLHRSGCPSWLKVRELDVLMCITPGPLGLGMSYRQCAKFLNINVKTVDRATTAIKEKFPEAWSRLQSMRRTMMRQAGSLRSPLSLDLMLDRCGHEGFACLAAKDEHQPYGTIPINQEDVKPMKAEPVNRKGKKTA